MPPVKCYICHGEDATSMREEKQGKKNPKLKIEHQTIALRGVQIFHCKATTQKTKKGNRSPHANLLEALKTKKKQQ